MKWLKEIDQITDSFKKEFGGLSEEKLNWKQNADVWSIAQNVDHLMLVNQTYFPILDNLHAGIYKPPFLSRLRFVVAFFERLIFSAVQPDRRKKMKTFSVWEPRTSEISQGILESFINHQSELKEKMARSESHIKNGAIIHSPASRTIVYRLEKAFDIIVSHELRHFEQSKEVLARLKETRA